MYKIYIETCNYKPIVKLAEYVKSKLLESDKFIVYTGIMSGTNNMMNLELDAHIVIQGGNNNGPEILVNETQKISNGLAKETYKELENIYYAKLNNGVIYKTHILDKENSNIPQIAINIANLEDEKELEWFNANCNQIANAISNGIIKSFSLKQC